MKTTWAIVAFLASASWCFGSLYAYPTDKKPKILLTQACVISEKMLKLKGFSSSFVIHGADLFGDEKQTGQGTWNIHYLDPEGNHIQIYIPFPTGKPTLKLIPHDHEKNGGVKEFNFEAIP